MFIETLLWIPFSVIDRCSLVQTSHWLRGKCARIEGTWQWDGFSGVFAEIGSSWVPYTTFWAVPILASNSRRYSYSKNDSPLSLIWGVADSAYQWFSDTGSRRLPASLIRGVADSPHHWYAESVTPRITDTESRLLNIFKENSVYRWYGESSTPRTSDTVSRRLPVSLSRRVTDSAYHRYGESTTPRIVESGSRRLRGLVIRGVTIQWKN